MEHQNLTEQFLSNFLADACLLDIKLYQINYQFYSFNNDNVMIINGGIELVFNKGSITLGFNEDMELYHFAAKNFEAFLKNVEYHELSVENFPSLHNLIGLKLSSYALKTIDFDFIKDYTMATESISHNAEISFLFENGASLQIAAVNYEFEDENSLPIFYYDVTAEIVVSINDVLSIKDLRDIH